MHSSEGDYDEREEQTPHIDAPRRHSLDQSILFEGSHTAVFIAEPHEQESDDEYDDYPDWTKCTYHDAEELNIEDADLDDRSFLEQVHRTSFTEAAIKCILWLYLYTIHYPMH